MNELFRDIDGKVCAAKVMFITTVFIFQIKAIISGMVFGGWSGGTLDYSGVAMVIGALGSVYWGRSHTKSLKVK